MKIIFGHSNMDLDCLGSMALCRYLYPEHQPVQSARLHPSSKNLYNLYRNHLNMLKPSELNDSDINSIIMVDASSKKRASEIFQHINNEPAEFIIYDHHLDEPLAPDFPDAQVYSSKTGANTTMIALKCMEKNISLNERDATIALTAIYADTGHFRHKGTAADDFTAASYCMDHGASLSLVNKFVKPLKEQHQLDMFHLLLQHLTYGNINGHFIATTYLELDKQIGGLAAVVEKVFEIESPDAMFAVFYFKKEHQILVIARSLDDSIDVNSLLSDFGGGGHRTAASALIKNINGTDGYKAFFQHIENRLQPAVLAGDIMSTNVDAINPEWTLIEASQYLEKINHTGAPVLDGSGTLLGFLTLRDIMKGRKGSNMNSPVRTYMTKKVVTCSPGTTIREIEHLMFTHNIGHLPVVVDQRVIGIITRTDYLKWYKE